MRSVHTVSTEIRSRKFTSAYIAALKPNTSICDISDPAVPGLVLTCRNQRIQGMAVPVQVGRHADAYHSREVPGTSVWPKRGSSR